MRSLSIFLGGLVFCGALRADDTYSFQVMLYRWDKSIVLAAYKAKASSFWGYGNWMDKGWTPYLYMGVYYYKQGASSGSQSAYYGVASSLSWKLTSEQAQQVENTINDLMADGDLALVDFSKEPIFPDSGDRAVLRLKEFGSTSVFNGEAAVVAYNADGDLALVKMSLNATTGNFEGVGYDSSGQKGVFSLPYTTGNDFKSFATFTAVKSTVDMPSGTNIVSSSTSSYLGGADSEGAFAIGGAVSGASSSLNSSSSAPVDSSAVSRDYSSHLNELIKGEQAILNYLMTDSVLPSDDEVNVADVISDSSQVKYIEDDVNDVLEGLPTEGKVNDTFTFADGVNKLIGNVFGAFPSVGQEEFNYNATVDLGILSVPVEIDFSRYNISAVRACFAFIILFLAACYSVVVVGKAFES